MPTQSMFPELATPLIRSTGILASQTLLEMATAGKISSDLPITDSQIQPASLDLRLGAVAYRVQASFLPRAKFDYTRQAEIARNAQIFSN